MWVRDILLNLDALCRTMDSRRRKIHLQYLVGRLFLSPYHSIDYSLSFNRSRMSRSIGITSVKSSPTFLTYKSSLSAIRAMESSKSFLFLIFSFNKLVIFDRP